jgi:soluble lytic murein transglycosylase
MKPTTKFNPLIAGLSLFTLSFATLIPTEVGAATNKQAHNRITHAKELLGKRYKSSTIRKTEKADNITVFITNSTRNLLPKKHKSSARQIASVILKESERYGFDPIFLMAVIQNESSFNPRMKGSVGEIGLMQIKPDTAEWISGLYKLNYNGADSLYRPEVNIRIGAAYLNKLRGQFDANSTHYLTAYNAGPKNVRKMISGKVAPKIYATAVMKRYFAIYSALSAAKGSQAERAERVLASVMNITAAHKSQL